MPHQWCTKCYIKRCLLNKWKIYFKIICKYKIEKLNFVDTGTKQMSHWTLKLRVQGQKDILEVYVQIQTSKTD